MNNSKIIFNSKKINTSDLKGIDKSSTVNYSDINTCELSSDSDSDSEKDDNREEYYTFSSDDINCQEEETDSDSNSSLSFSDVEDLTPIKKKNIMNKSINGMKVTNRTGKYKILQEDNDFEEEL